jgi:NAD(P)-dependent dehydrogenase (short-subunit alcohol dehydrogenase family)
MDSKFKTVFVTGADRGLGAGMVKLLLEQGYRVFAGQFMPGWKELDGMKAQYPKALSIIPLDVGSMDSVRKAAELTAREADSLDVLISNAGIAAKDAMRTIREPQNYDSMKDVYNVNALGSLRVAEAFLPLLDKGTGKRLCFVSSEAGSIGRSHREFMIGYCMSKAALNMGVTILYNSLRGGAYTFRLYYPGWIRSYMGGRKSERGDLEPDEAAVPAVAYCMSPTGTYDEDTMVMRGFDFKEWPW